MRVRAGSGADSALAAVATLTAAWPISTLLQQPTWLSGTVLLLAVIAVSGFGARSLALRGWQILLVQLVCSVLAAGAIYARDYLWYGLPTFRTAEFAGALIGESISTAQKFAAPAPTSQGLIFVAGCSMGLAALSVDYLAVTRRSPSLAGLPLLTVFLAVAANRGSTLPVVFFLATAAMWLILVARADGTILRRWGTTVPVAHTPAPQTPASHVLSEHASVARMVGVVALAAAVAVPVILPQAAPTFLVSGLGRHTAGGGNAGLGVGFSQSIDLSLDLKSRSSAPVLTYTTTAISPPPLRVTVGATYRPEAGLWLPWGRPWSSTPGKAVLSVNPNVPEPAGLSPDVPRQTFLMKVQDNRLEDPFLAAPYPLVSANLSGIAWGSDSETQSVRVAERPDAYSLSYLQVVPTTAILRKTQLLSDRERNLFDLDLRLDGPYVDRVTTLTSRLTAGKSSAYDKAMAIQQYLRADGGFTYSLTLAPPVRNQSGSTAGYDALTNFLITKQGYCVQFATAMVMMSRSAGIPARMDLGFLPGTQSKGVWTVIAADAHAWPELYLDGIGWTRFEPTPSRGAPPPYAVPAASPDAAVNPARTDTATAPARGSTNRKDVGDLSAGGRSGPTAWLSPASILRWLTHGWGALTLGSLIMLLGLIVVPGAAAWRRRRSRARAHTAAERVEVEWDLLTRSLGDLGIAPSPSRTPRQVRTYYEREASLQGPDSLALGRVVQALERSRYAAAAPLADADVSADSRRVLNAAAAHRAGRDRLRAALWPSSGITQLRSAVASPARLIRTCGRVLSELVHRPRRGIRNPEAGISLKGH